jgi:hypothetical protein
MRKTLAWKVSMVTSESHLDKKLDHRAAAKEAVQQKLRRTHHLRRQLEHEARLGQQLTRIDSIVRFHVKRDAVAPRRRVSERLLVDQKSRCLHGDTIERWRRKSVGITDHAISMWMRMGVQMCARTERWSEESGWNEVESLNGVMMKSVPPETQRSLPPPPDLFPQIHNFQASDLSPRCKLPRAGW